MRLVKAGKIRADKPLSPVDGGADFGVPPNWRWTRLGNITSYIQRGKSPKYAASEGALVVSQKCVQWTGLDLTVAKQVTSVSLADYEPIRFLREGDLLWNSTGTGTIGRVIRLVQPPKKLVCDSHVTVVRCLEVDPEYVRIWLRSDHVYGQVEDRAAGSTNQVELTGQMAVNQIVPLPPLAEQRRIVAKVDELMALCDRLEATRAAREATRDRLAAASLARLNVPDPENFHSDARFALDALPALTTRPDQIKQFRQTILNLAMRGKLVPQDPNDEPAQFGQYSTFGSDNRKATKSVVPFSLPKGWDWSEFGEVATFENGDRGKKYPTRDEYVEKGVAWINTGHIQPDGSLSIVTMNYITRAKYESLGGGKIRPGDLVYCLRGATFGKTAFVHPFVEGAIASSLMIVRPGPRLDLRFTYFYLVSPLARSQLMRFDNGTAQPNLSSANVKKYIIPIPSLAEQQRIVAKIDELMVLCERLNASLTRSSAIQRRLLDAVLAEALAPGATQERAA